jgi:hypothetical protein
LIKERKNLVKTLEEFEKNGVYNWFLYNNYSMWPAIKVYISHKETNTLRKKHLAGNKLGFILKSIFMFFISLFNIVWVTLFVREKHICFGSFVGLIQHDKRYIDSLIPEGHNYNVHILNCGHISHFFPNIRYVIKNKCIVDNYFFGIISKIIMPLLKNRFKPYYENCTKLKDQLHACGIEITQRELLIVLKKYISLYIIYRYAIKILNPKKALLISAYTKTSHCAALKDLLLEVIEAQHGLIGPQTPGYNYANLKSVNNIKIPIPDKMLVYNDFWKKELLTSNYLQESDVSIVGNKKIDLVMNKSNNPYKKKSYILFTGQGINIKEISEFLFDLCNSILNLNSNLHVLYRPHPKEDPKDYEIITNILCYHSNFSIIDNRVISTEKLIADSAMHISYNSACHFDAIHLLGKTYFLDLGDSNIMEYYANKYGTKKFVKITNINDILNPIVK